MNFDSIPISVPPFNETLKVPSVRRTKP